MQGSIRAAGVRTLLSQLKREKAAHKTDRAYQVWQERSHPEAIQSEEMMWEKIEYIHDSPVARSCVDDPLHWRHSSARNCAGQAGLFPCVRIGGELGREDAKRPRVRSHAKRGNDATLRVRTMRVAGTVRETHHTRLSWRSTFAGEAAPDRSVDSPRARRRRLLPGTSNGSVLTAPALRRREHRSGPSVVRTSARSPDP